MTGNIIIIIIIIIIIQLLLPSMTWQCRSVSFYDVPEALHQSLYYLTSSDTDIENCLH